MPENPRWFSPPLYGLKTYGDLFTDRQLVALTAFSDLVGEAMTRIRRDATAAGLPDDAKPLRDGGAGAAPYAEAVGTYLGVCTKQSMQSQLQPLHLASRGWIGSSRPSEDRLCRWSGITPKLIRLQVLAAIFMAPSNPLPRSSRSNLPTVFAGRRSRLMRLSRASLLQSSFLQTPVL